MADSFTPDGQKLPVPQPPSATPVDPDEGPNPLDPIDEVYVIPDEPGEEAQPPVSPIPQVTGRMPGSHLTKPPKSPSR